MAGVTQADIEEWKRQGRERARVTEEAVNTSLRARRQRGEVPATDALDTSMVDLSGSQGARTPGRRHRVTRATAGVSRPADPEWRGGPRV